MFAPANSAPELMQLGQSETLCVLNQHDTGIGNVDPDFDDRRTDEGTGLSSPEPVHDRLLFWGGDAAMQQLTTKRPQPPAPGLELSRGRLDIELLALVDQWIYDIRLAPCFELFAHE